MAQKTRGKRKVRSKPAKTPKSRKPENMSLNQWQVALRREFGLDQKFRSKNVGTEPVYSVFAVTNPTTDRTYRVAIRGAELGVNFCSCPDFAVNALGTCKHIEWLIAKLKRKHGARKAFAKPFRPPYTEVYVEYGARRRIRFRAGTRCPAAIRKKADRFFTDDGYLQEDAHRNFGAFVQAARESDDDIRIYDDALEFVARLRDDEHRRAAIASTFNRGSESAAFDRLLNAKLYPYQKEGALFAANAGRCLIADDMGLGKTIQAIAAVEILAKTAGVERALVVCPTAVKYQWKQEIERFTGRTATVVGGLRHARAVQYADDAFYAITNYETVHRDLDLINGRRPDVVILDEAQRIKNWETRRAKSIKQIESPYAIVLTGTPLENRLSDLHSIMEFVDRFYLGPLYRFLSEHQHTDDCGKVIGYKDLDRIQESLRSVMIRRHKRNVLHELPPRTDKHLFVEMTKEQDAIHEENREIVARIVAKWRRRGFLNDEDQCRLMVALQYMRMACNSTYLVDKLTDHGPKMDECCLLLDDVLAHPDNKAVIFSQWLGTHELLIRRLEAEDRAYSFYHGSLDGKGRKKALEEFRRNGNCRILLCTDSGGVGLNLQEATVVINMDQPWNPALLEQRIGRVHRLGQDRNVQVYHFVSRDTIEHAMLGVLKFKSSLSEGVLDGGESEIFLGGTKMKQFMESVETVATWIPHDATPQPATGEPQASAAALAGDHLDPVAGRPASETNQQAWNEVLAAGTDLLEKLGRALQPVNGSTPDATANANGMARPESNGKNAPRIAIPDGETLEQVGTLLAGFGDMLRAFARQKQG